MMEAIFTNIYENCLWNNNYNPEYNGGSGGGSEVNYNKDTYIPLLKNFIKENNIKTVVDLGCGDFKCGPFIYDDLDVLYTGYDAYKRVVDYNSKLFSSQKKYTFLHLDFFNEKDRIVSGDLCILKDVLQHWSLECIYEFMNYLVEQKKFKYILICNCCNQAQDNTDIINGDGRSLSIECYPLKKYNLTKLCNYNTKEVSLLDLSSYGINR